MKRILLIEDNIDILENTAEILSLAGYEVYTASGGKEGVEKAIALHPDLIVSDIMMPGLDGYGVFLLIQKHADLVDIPFIFLTAKTTREDLRKGMEMGVDDYITKPFTDTELLHAIETRLKRAQQLSGALESTGVKNTSEEMALETLFANKITNKYKRKQIIFSEGNHPYYLFYVVKGKVKAFKSSEDSKELIVGLYAEGDFMGYTALLEESTYKVTAEAMEDAEIAIVPKKDFFDLINGNPAIARRFIQILAKNNNQKAGQMVQLAYDSMRKRVARTLLLLKDKYQSGAEEDFSIQIRREELANLSGTSTESLIRTLSDFKNEGLIRIQGGNVGILNEKKLKNMLN